MFFVAMVVALILSPTGGTTSIIKVEGTIRRTELGFIHPVIIVGGYQSR